MKKKKTTIPGIIKWVIAIILVVMQVYPFFYVFTSSFKSLDDFRQLPAYALPSKWVLTNFINVFTKSHMLTYFKNSIIVLIGVLIPLLLFALMAGFALSKIKFKGRKFVLNYFLLGLMLPMQVALIPLFTIFNKMGLINTYRGLVLCYIAFELPICIWTMQSYFETIPSDLIEAAEIDGLAKVQTLWHIFLPVAFPGLAASGIMTFIGIWNNFLLANTLLIDEAKKTLPVVIADFSSRDSMLQGDVLAASMIVCIPSFLFALFAQKYLVGGLTSGSVKG